MKLPAIFRRRSSGLVAEDAGALIDAFGESAYEQARTRAREARLGKMIDANRPPGHWDRVRSEIARRSLGKEGVTVSTSHKDDGASGPKERRGAGTGSARFAPRAAADPASGKRRLGHPVTIPRARHTVLLAGGSRSRFSDPSDSWRRRYAVAPAGALLTGLVAAVGPAFPPR